MAVKFNVSAKGNPLKPEEPKKFYANAKADGEVTFKKLSQEIAAGSTTVSDSDILAVLNDLTKFMNKHLLEGRIVRFGDFGNFQISISSEGAPSEEKFNQSLIKSAKVIYRPGVDVRDMLKLVKYEKSSK